MTAQPCRTKAVASDGDYISVAAYGDSTSGEADGDYISVAADGDYTSGEAVAFESQR